MTNDVTKKPRKPRTKKTDAPAAVLAPVPETGAPEKKKRRAGNGKRAARISKKLSREAGTLTFCKRGPLMRFARVILREMGAKMSDESWDVLRTMIDTYILREVARASIPLNHRKASMLSASDFVAAKKVVEQI